MSNRATVLSLSVVTNDDEQAIHVAEMMVHTATEIAFSGISVSLHIDVAAEEDDKKARIALNGEVRD